MDKNTGILGGLLGTVKTDNKIALDGSTVREVAFYGFLAAIGAGLVIKLLGKVFGL